jgi:small conductance mechanosensitive channel
MSTTDGWLDTTLSWLTVQGVNIVLAITLLVVGRWAIHLVKRLFMRWIERSDHMDPIVEQFLASLLYYGLFAILIIAAPKRR